MKLTLALEELISAAITEGPPVMQALRAELQAEARDPATSALKRKLLPAAGDRLREAEEAQAAVTDQRPLASPQVTRTLAEYATRVSAATGQPVDKRSHKLHFLRENSRESHNGQSPRVI